MRREHHTYEVQLTESEREQLHTLMRSGKTPVKEYSVARVLLAADSYQEERVGDEELAQALGMSRRTVIRIRERYCEGGLQRVLKGAYHTERPEIRRLDGEKEARLIALACSQAPNGQQRWTLRLLADAMVRLEIVEHICPETVRQALKKTSSSPGSNDPGASPR